MGAFFIATLRIKDPEKFGEYATKSGATFAPFGGELVMKGKAESALAGELNHENAAIIRFPDMDALNGWYNSPEYQAIIPLRDAGADITLVSYNEPA